VRGDLASNEITPPDRGFVVKQNSTRDSGPIASAINGARVVRSEFSNRVWAPGRKSAFLAKASATPEHLGGRSLVKANRSASYHFKQPEHSKMVNVIGVERLIERFPDVSLSSEVVDLIRPYPLHRSLDALVLQELQRYSFDGLRNHRRRTATITTKNTIPQSQKMLSKIPPVLACDAAN
jgi:hypothetical protein